MSAEGSGTLFRLLWRCGSNPNQYYKRKRFSIHTIAIRAWQNHEKVSMLIAYCVGDFDYNQYKFIETINLKAFAKTRK